MKQKLLTLSVFFLVLSAAAQVGVNNNEPIQTLDVNGKVKLADDDIAPSEGTMRYNDIDKSFEGYDGAQWNSFYTKKSSALPSNPIPIFGRVNGIGKTERKSMRFGDWLGDFNFLSVPTGKLVIITGIYPRPNGLTKDSDFQCSIGVSSSDGGSQDFRSVLLIFVKTATTSPLIGDSAPLFVLRPGEYLTVTHESTSSINFINMDVRGFLVDDLNY